MNAFYISIGTKVKWNNPSIEKFEGKNENIKKTEYTK